MTQPRFVAFLAAVSLGINGLLVGCTANEEAPDGSQTPKPVSISESDLPTLVLDVTEVSVDGVLLPLDPNDSGPQSKSDQSDGIDPERMAAVLDKYNWQAAYYQDFGTGSQDSPVFNASVMLDLLDTHENAVAALAERMALATEWEGRTYEGATAESVEFFDVAEMNARGMKMKVRLTDGTTFTMTNIDFVRGSMIVDIGTATLDDRDLVPATLELVRLANAHLIDAGIEPGPNPAAQAY